LNEKLANLESQTKQSAIVQQGQQHVGLPVQLLSPETNSLRSALHFLKRENARLKGIEAQRQLYVQLPPLTKQHKKNSSTKMEDQKVNPTQSDMMKCNKEVTMLIKEIQIQRATSSVVNLIPSSIPVLQQLQLQKSEMETLQQRGAQLKAKMQTLVMNLQEGNKVPASFSSFPSTAVTKSLRDLKPILFAKVSLPSTCSQSNTQIVVNSHQFEQIHSVFVK